MIQFNLLPDVKLEYIRARKTKRLTTLVSLIVPGVAAGFMILLFLVVNVVQRTHLNNLTNDIKRDSQILEETPDLDKILTVQNQLENLTALHDSKPVGSRLRDFITRITPEQATISQLNVDYTTNTIKITGTAETLEIVNKFVDTIKFTEYRIEGQDDAEAFSEVVLANFGRSQEQASYQILFKYNPTIFSNSNEVSLVVPNIVSTRSTTEKPSALFEEVPETTQEEQ